MRDFVQIPLERLPLAPAFVDFVSHWLDDPHFAADDWSAQMLEELITPIPNQVMRRLTTARLERLVLEENAQRAVESVYRWFEQLTCGSTEGLEGFCKRYTFLLVVGAPRTGGSYLTAELYKALKYEPRAIPTVIAHDGFPDTRLFGELHRRNEWTTTLMRLSEYLTMIELFFAAYIGDKPAYVPKKLLKAIYAGGLFRECFGPNAEYFITIRHPIAACVSTYEKSGGLPEAPLPSGRSTIECWVHRDIAALAYHEVEVGSLGYFETYIRYWEQYYILLATSGLLRQRRCSILPFGSRRLEDAANGFHQRFDSNNRAAAFKRGCDALDRHPEWISRANVALERVASVWELVGLPFPMRELLEAQ